MNIKKNVKSFSCFLSLLMLFFSCEKYDSINIERQNNSSNKSKEITGQELFKSIFFFGGEISNKIDVVKKSEGYFRYNNDDEFKYEIDKLNSDVVTQIKNSDDSFFNNFKSLITSGKHLKVRDGFKLASIQIFNSLSKLEQFKDYDFKRFEDLNIEDYIDEDGNIIESDKLKELFPVNEYAVSQGDRGLCVAVAIVAAYALALVAISYVVAVQVAAVAWVAAVYAAVAFWSACKGRPKLNPGKLEPVMTVTDYEITVNKLVKLYEF